MAIKVTGVLDILSDPSKWCKESLAKDINGFVTDIYSVDAYSFCITGAFRKVNCHNEKWKPFKRLIISKYPERINIDIVPSFNDHPDTTFEEVVELIKEAGL